MFIINTTDEFRNWLKSLRDSVAKASILARLKRASLGNFGDYKSLGGGVYEMRISVGKGYRIYYAQQDKVIYLILTGGDKSTQSKDIKLAQEIWSQVKKIS